MAEFDELFGPYTKWPAAVRLVSIDLSDDLAQGVTISSVTPTSVNKLSGASTTSTIIDAANSGADGQVISVMCQAGAQGEEHLVTVSCVCSDSQTVTPKFILRIL